MIDWVPTSVAIFHTALLAEETGGRVIMGITDDGYIVLAVSHAS